MTNLNSLINKYLEHRKDIHTPLNTYKGIIKNTSKFKIFLANNNITELAQINRPQIELFQRYLRKEVNKYGEFNKIKTQNEALSVIKKFFSYLEKREIIPKNPTRFIDYAKVPQELPKDILTNADITKIIAGINIHTLEGFRDRTIIEVLYATGIRRQELVNLNIRDIDLENRQLMVLQGKGRKDRLLPLNKIATKFLANYLAHIRPKYVAKFRPAFISRDKNTNISEDNEALFLGNSSKRLGAHGLMWLVKKYIAKAGITKKVAIHSFRHAFATELLKAGADIRYVQELLGHANLDTTQRYTKIVIEDLKRVYKKFHPRS